MQIQIYNQASDFLTRVGEPLARREAANNLMIGIAMRAASDPNAFKSQPLFVTVDSVPGHPVLAAVMTPPYRLVLNQLESEGQAAIPILCRFLFEQGIPLPGVLGPSAVADEFAACWSQLTGQPAQVSMRERVYELRQVTAPLGVPGSLRLAQAEEAELLSAWTQAFFHESMHMEISMEEARQDAQARMQSSSLFVWDDGGPVSIAASMRRTPQGGTVGLVYTPPELRRRGYASACVAALSQHLLDEGLEFCALFTDLDYPTSNKIYMEIGYSPLEDYMQYDFGPFPAK